jgi:hypothetical protein
VPRPCWEGCEPELRRFNVSGTGVGEADRSLRALGHNLPPTVVRSRERPRLGRLWGLTYHSVARFTNHSRPERTPCLRPGRLLHAGLQAKPARRYVATTDSPRGAPGGPNGLGGRFAVAAVPGEPQGVGGRCQGLLDHRRLGLSRPAGPRVAATGGWAAATPGSDAHRHCGRAASGDAAAARGLLHHLNWGSLTPAVYQGLLSRQGRMPNGRREPRPWPS